MIGGVAASALNMNANLSGCSGITIPPACGNSRATRSTCTVHASYARRLLRHTNISTTQRYMHLDDNELADAQDLVD